MQLYSVYSVLNLHIPRAEFNVREMMEVHRWIEQEKKEAVKDTNFTHEYQFTHYEENFQPRERRYITRK